MGFYILWIWYCKHAYFAVKGKIFVMMMCVGTLDKHVITIIMHI